MPPLKGFDAWALGLYRVWGLGVEEGVLFYGPTL